MFPPAPARLRSTLQNAIALRTAPHRRGVLAGLAALILLASVPAGAQLSSNPAAVNLNAVLNSRLAVAASPGLVNFSLVPSGIANGSSTITITTSWVLRPSNGTLTLYAYFSTTTALSDGAGHVLPSANVSGSANGGAFTPFTGASPFAAGSSITIFSQRILGFNRSGTRNDTLNLRIDTTGLGLPAGTYTGLLRIQAQAI